MRWPGSLASSAFWSPMRCCAGNPVRLLPLLLAMPSSSSRWCRVPSGRWTTSGDWSAWSAICADEATPPEYVGVGESGGTVFTVQRRLPGRTLDRGPGMPPAPELFAAVLRSLLAAIELQRDAGDLAQPPWPAWLLDTIETGGCG